MINIKNRKVKVLVLLQQYQKSIGISIAFLMKFISVLVLAIHFARCIGIGIANTF